MFLSLFFLSMVFIGFISNSLGIVSCCCCFLVSRVLHAKDATSVARPVDAGPSTARSESSKWVDPPPTPESENHESTPSEAAEAT